METIQNLLSEYTAELAHNNEKLEQNQHSSAIRTRHNGEVEKRIDQLISSLPTIIIALSRDNNIVLWNATAEAVELFPPMECENYFAAAGYDRE